MSVAAPPQAPPGTGSGTRRKEDTRLLCGQGEFLGDVHRPDLKHVAILRSPVAHARIRDIDGSGALTLPGVIGVFTGAELAGEIGEFSHHLPMIPTLRQITWSVLATGKVRFVGEPVAAVVAESRYIAEDALELIEVDYEELPPVTGAEAGLETGAPLLYEDWGDNVFLYMPGSHGDVETAFANADGVLRERFTHHRISGLPMEGHGALGEFDPASGRLEMYVSTQVPHTLRTVISDISSLSESKIRVVAPDMGGGFGNKAHFMREEVLVAVLAMRVRHPIVWLQDRTENLLAGLHSREQVHEVEVAYRHDGRILGLRADFVVDVGSPELYILGCAPAIVTTAVVPNCYDLQDYAFELRCVATNKGPMGGYRGYGQPQGIFLMERVLDLVGEKLGVDPVTMRRLNTIPDEPRPYVTATGAVLDTGSFNDQLTELLVAADYDGACRARDEARAADRLVGVGIAQMVEPTAPNIHGLAGRFGGYEMAMLTVQPDGKVNVAVGTKSQGQGHETIYGAVAAEVLGISPDDVQVSDGDTAGLPYGIGTWGSRSAVMGGGAVIKAAREVRDKMAAIAAGLLDAPADQIEASGGFFRLGEAAIPFGQIAAAAYLHTFLLPPGMDPGLSVVVGYDPGNTSPFPDERGKMNVAATYSTAAAAAVVEVDAATGVVTVEDLTIVHDCGTVIDRVLLDGQIHGAIAQALGQTFYEEIHYDANGQPQTSTLLDYMIPGFGDVIEPRIIHRETPSELIGGFRGAGEGAIIVTPAALAAAVHDALAPLGIPITQSNLSPPLLRSLIRDGVEV